MSVEKSKEIDVSVESSKVISPQFIMPFILITILFPLWGFANDITNPMVAAFKNILLISNFKSSLVQFAFYGGYAVMAIPAALFIKRFSYKKGVLIGLALYAIGCLLFIPSGVSMLFPAFLLSYFIMTCGLSFLETTANPYVLSMGSEKTATRRLNLSQSFNPMGSIMGMFVAGTFILANLDGTTETGRRYLQTAASEQKTAHIQIVEKQEHVEVTKKGEKKVGTLPDIERILEEKEWRGSRKLLKKGAELSGGLYQTLAVMADPKPKQAEEVNAELKTLPSPSYIDASVGAVMVVLQMKAPPPPADVEVRRDELFFNSSGLEQALVLNREALTIDKIDPEILPQARAEFAAAAASAKQLSDIFSSLYNPKEGATAVDGDPAELLAQVRKSLSAGAVRISSIPAQSLQGYYDALGADLKAIQKRDLGVVVKPYAMMGVFLLLVLALFAFKLPSNISHEGSKELDIGGTFKRLIDNPAYIEGVLAQAFYVGAQIMCWTFIIQYAELELGLSKATAQYCNILAMIIFVSSRFICTFLLHYVKPGGLLAALAVGGIALTTGTVFIEGYTGLYCLIGVSACMSLMFPTIYGIALRGLGDDAKLGSAGLILAIGGGCLMPPMQGKIIDMPAFDLGFMELASVRVSFLLPLVCFIVIALYGFRTIKHLKDV